MEWLNKLDDVLEGVGAPKRGNEPSSEEENKIFDSSTSSSQEESEDEDKAVPFKVTPTKKSPVQSGTPAHPSAARLPGRTMRTPISQLKRVSRPQTEYSSSSSEDEEPQRTLKLPGSIQKRPLSVYKRTIEPTTDLVVEQVEKETPDFVRSFPHQTSPIQTEENQLHDTQDDGRLVRRLEESLPEDKNQTVEQQSLSLPLLVNKRTMDEAAGPSSQLPQSETGWKQQSTRSIAAEATSRAILLPESVSSPEDIISSESVGDDDAASISAQAADSLLQETNEPGSPAEAEGPSAVLSEASKLLTMSQIAPVDVDKDVEQKVATPEPSHSSLSNEAIADTDAEPPTSQPMSQDLPRDKSMLQSRELKFSQRSKESLQPPFTEPLPAADKLHTTNSGVAKGVCRPEKGSGSFDLDKDVMPADEKDSSLQEIDLAASQSSSVAVAEPLPRKARKDEKEVATDDTQLETTTADVVREFTPSTTEDDHLPVEEGEGPGEKSGDSDVAPPKSFPRQIECRSEFEVDRLLPSWEDTGLTPFESRMNCRGVVHVRILRAQLLPCSVGSSVQAVVSLNPWKGKVRTSKAKTVTGAIEQHGVCVQWDEDETKPISMVHAYSSEESPLPTIHIDLVFSTLGMFEFTMCSLDLACQILMQSPLVAKRQWFATSVVGDQAKSASIDREPLVQIEAMFEPADSQAAQEVSAPVDVVEVGSKGSVEASLLEDVTLPSTPRRTVASQRADERSQNGLTLSVQSVQQKSKKLSSKPHLLRLITYYTPASCCVCRKSIMSGLRKRRAFRCEECGLDCCDDCRVHVDIQLPCGSDLTQEAIDKSIQQKLTPDNILNVVAPLDETPSQKLLDDSIRSRQSTALRRQDTTGSVTTRLGDDESGIGSLKIEFLGARIFEDIIPAESSLDDLTKVDRYRTGDYYVRLSRSGSDKTARTHTVQNSGRPRFESGEMTVSVPHYGTEFRIEVVDASTDKCMGIFLLTAQALLQEQRDLVVQRSGVPLLSFLYGPGKHQAKSRLICELRTGFKSGFSSDFFSASKAQQQVARDGAPRPGDIIGWIEISACLEEDIDRLFGRDPYECPGRPPDDLNMATFQLHLARISHLFEDIRKGIKAYQYTVSWKNPALTSLSLIIFLMFCRRFDPAYFGNVPVAFLIIYMLYRALVRSRRTPETRFIQREIGSLGKSEKISVNYSLHRPVGLLSVSVKQGRNIRSQELGLPGGAGCLVMWDPTRFMPEDKQKGAANTDQSLQATHEIGSTDYVFTTNPTWEGMIESETAKRLKLLLPNHGKFFESSDSERARDEVEFPVLQPFAAVRDDTQVLKPWSSSPAAIVVQVKFKDVFNLIPGSEHVLGEVAIPFSSLTRKGKISGWFHISDVGTKAPVPGKDEGDSSAVQQRDNTSNLPDDSPQLFLELNWRPPGTVDDKSEEMQREASFVIQEEMVRAAVVSRQQKLGIVGSSIGAFNTVRGLSGNLLMIQNMLGSALDLIESIKNAFNFTDPFKSSVLLAGFVLLWIFFAVVPTRAIVMLAGLAQYGITFHSRYSRLFIIGQKGRSTRNSEGSPKTDASSPAAIWFMNAIRGMPNDEDLRKAYFWESRQVGAREMKKHAEEKRNSRLKRLWRAQWYSSVEILQEDNKGGDYYWQNAFALIQGHRFLWWRSADEFDSGEAAQGRIFLEGHAGLGTPSPPEMASIEKDSLSRVCTIFGRGVDKQKRVTLLAPAKEVKDQLESAVVFAISGKKD